MTHVSFLSAVSSNVSLSNLNFFYPVIVLGIIAFLILALGVVTENKKVFSGITFGGLIVAFVLTLFGPSGGKYIFGNTSLYNNFGIYFALILIISSLYIVFPAMKGLKKKPEIFYATLLFVTIGMIIAAFSYNLIVLFISFEAVSVGTYVLAGFGKEKRNLEATAKYFFTGTIATAFIVFGSSFFYIATGSFDLTSTEHIVSISAMVVALAFLVIGFGFKLAIFPMHQWAIDAYDGTENSVSAFLSTGSKVVAFLIILKIFLLGFSVDFEPVYYFFVLLAIFTMTYANIAALSQDNLKRLLAYSSVAQAGYLILIVALVAFVGNITSSVVYFAVATGMFYSLVYIFMKGGSFLTMNVVKKEKIMLSDIAGLGKKSPVTAVSFSILLLALAGIPITGGFLAKYYLFLSLISGHLWWLAVIAILNSAISVFYYFRVIMYMFWKEPTEENQFDLSNFTKTPIIASAVITVFLFAFFGLFPMMQSIAPGLFGV